MPTKANKRRQKRYVKRCIAEFMAGRNLVKGICSDFSLNGLFLRTTHSQPVGSVLDICIFLSDDTVSKIRGEVMRSLKSSGKWFAGRKITLSSEKEGMGIRIIEKDENYLHLIRSLLK